MKGAPEPATTQAQTRQRLLEAAGQVFAENGYRCSTVRDICAIASANVAAVNYHFGDKMGLYTAVLSYSLGAALEQYPPDMGVVPDAPAEDRLRAYVRSFLFRMLGKGAPAWYGRLMAREMIEPTTAMDTVLADAGRLLTGKLEGIVRELLPADVSDEVARHCTCSIAGQCCFYRHAEPMIQRLYPEHGTATEHIERLAEHIWRFSIEGLRAYHRSPALV